MTDNSLRALVAEIADIVLPNPCVMPTSLNGAPLFQYQSTSVNRLFHAIMAYNGALLADATGLGKTRTAIAVADALDYARPRRSRPFHVVVALPARLRGMWLSRFQTLRPKTLLQLVSHYQLSRFQLPREAAAADLLIVDEAHHFSNRKTQRYQCVTSITRHTHTLLLTASPVTNSIDQLVALLELFLNLRQVQALQSVTLAHFVSCDDTAAPYESDQLESLLSQVVVCRNPRTNPEVRKPKVEVHVLRYDMSPEERSFFQSLTHDPDWLRLPYLYQWWPSQLFQQSVARLVETHPSALLPLLDIVVDYYLMLASRLNFSQHGWVEVDRSAFLRLQRRAPQQLQLPLVCEQTCDNAVQGLLPGVASTSLLEIDAEELFRQKELVNDLYGRAKSLLTTTHQNETLMRFTASLTKSREKVILFTQSIAYALSLYRDYLRKSPMQRVAAITGEGGKAFGGESCAPEEIISLFNKPYATPNAVDVLIATDCLSEGVEFRNCRQMVLCDLPQAPLRIEQRIGRITRISSHYHDAQIYLLRPVDWKDPLNLEDSLRRKLGAAKAVELPLTEANAVIGKETEWDSGATGMLAVYTTRDGALSKYLGRKIWEGDSEPIVSTCIYAGISGLAGMRPKGANLFGGAEVDEVARYRFLRSMVKEDEIWLFAQLYGMAEINRSVMIRMVGERTSTSWSANYVDFESLFLRSKYEVVLESRWCERLEGKLALMKARLQEIVTTINARRLIPVPGGGSYPDVCVEKVVAVAV